MVLLGVVSRTFTPGNEYTERIYIVCVCERERERDLIGEWENKQKERVRDKMSL
jgi:hypothetical protein